MIIPFFQESLDSFHHSPHAPNGGYHVHLTIKAVRSHCPLLMLFLVSTFSQLSVYSFSKLSHLNKI